MGISVWQLSILMLIVLLLFGSGKLRSLGGDLGGVIRSFRHAVSEDDKKDD